MKRSCTLMEKYILLIKNGQKKIEARVAIEMFAKWREGDVVDFFSRRNPSIRVLTEITTVKKYKTFREMLEIESPTKLIPGINDVSVAENEYLKIPNYAERERLGVLAFHLKVIG